MKTAIYHCDYHSYGTYKPNRVNLGDYIQSIAAAQYFSKVDTTIDRDSLSSVSEEISAIGNGWYCIDKARHSLQDNLNLLPVAVHINNRSDDVADTVRTFAKKNGPFCREIQRILIRYDGEKIERTTHECPLSTTHEQRFSMALDLLRKYASARCVITSRIHCALLCLALGTPVILATKSYDALRYRGIDKFLNFVFINEDGSQSQRIETERGDIVNTDEFREKANQLRKLCTEFSKKVS